MEEVERSYLCREEEEARYNMGEVGCGHILWIGEVMVDMMMANFKGKIFRVNLRRRSLRHSDHRGLRLRCEIHKDDIFLHLVL